MFASRLDVVFCVWLQRICSGACTCVGCGNTKHGARRSWSNEEDKTILEAQRTHDGQWAEIAKLVPGRTESEVEERSRRSSRWIAVTCSKACLEKSQMQHAMQCGQISGCEPAQDQVDRAERENSNIHLPTAKSIDVFKAKWRVQRGPRWPERKVGTLVTKADGLQLRTSRRSSSGYTCVKSTGTKFKAYAYVEGKQLTIGTGFDTSVEAAVAYARFCETGLTQYRTTQSTKSGLKRISKPVLEKSKRYIRSCRDQLGSFDVAEDAASAVAMKHLNVQCKASWQVGEVCAAPVATF